MYSNIVLIVAIIRLSVHICPLIHNILEVVSTSFGIVSQEESCAGLWTLAVLSFVFLFTFPLAIHVLVKFSIFLNIRFFSN